MSDNRTSFPCNNHNADHKQRHEHFSQSPLHQGYNFSTTMRRKLLGVDCAQGVIQSNLGSNASNGASLGAGRIIVTKIIPC